MNAQGALIIPPIAVETADTEREVFTATLVTEFTRFVVTNTHAMTDSTVEIRHIPKGATSGAQHRIYRAAAAGEAVAHVLEAQSEGQGVTLVPGDRISLLCDRTDTFVKAYGITQTTRLIRQQ